METEVPEEFGIYDLKDFLNVYDLFDKPKLQYQTKIILKDTDLLDYHPTETHLLVAPKRIQIIHFLIMKLSLITNLNYQQMILKIIIVLEDILINFQI